MRPVQPQGSGSGIDDQRAVGKAFIAGGNTDAAAKPAYGVVEPVGIKDCLPLVGKAVVNDLHLRVRLL